MELTKQNDTDFYDMVSPFCSTYLIPDMRKRDWGGGGKLMILFFVRKVCNFPKRIVRKYGLTLPLYTDYKCENSTEWVNRSNSLNIPSKFSFCMTSSKSFLVINCRASFSFVSFMCGRVVSKYWNSPLVGLSVERAPNFQHAFLGTLSFIAKLNQFPRTSDVPSRAKAISSRISPVITSRTFLSSAQPAVNEMQLQCGHGV